jgi:hypothetical protein
MKVMRDTLMSDKNSGGKLDMSVLLKIVLRVLCRDNFMLILFPRYCLPSH